MRDLELKKMATVPLFARHSRSTLAAMSTTSTEDFERSCDQVFNKLQELAQELKSHDHEEIHFNIEHAAQYVEHNKIGVKFKEQVRLLNGDVSYELICAINDCNTHLNDCMSICKRMGTPSWSTEQDSRLTMSWTFVYASLSKAGLILKLKPLEAQAFLAFNRQQPSFEPPTISRRESFMSNAGSENFTIEGRAERRERAERQRQGQRREPILVTPTGTRLRTQPNRTSASVRSVAASTSSASSSTASLRLPRRPAVPEREKWVINPSIISTPRTPPPEYTPIPKDTRPVIPPDEKPPLPSPQPSTKSVRTVASEPQLAAPGPPSHHTHYTGNVFHIYQGVPNTPPPQAWHTPRHLPQQPVPPIWPVPFQQPVPQPYRPPRVAAYRPSRLSLRETAALHLTPMPGLAVDIMKPEARCTHGVRHFKGHPPCQWGCCNARGCGQVFY
ncbi:hypothetical protein FOMG_09608 [Fusarium oxysporum f. sp. melonis 26406]|uniref:Uncharacterized protein n=1 Tax=Fusarium oxysporum f. sp. melonis 26406 TaxID=1089452 RepID=W9ZYF7_FUSOX|nr:hypothetical protein FOMG_09608 [Fusarium oxysporum f. sp. melonis 26406]